MSDKKEIKGEAKKGDETSKMGGRNTGFELSTQAFGASATAIVDEQVVDDANADQLAKGKYNMLLREFLTGEGGTTGNPKIRAGKTVELKRIGQRFSGIYYVTASKHIYGTGAGYVTKFTVHRSGV